MDIQILNEIANPARQVSISQVGASVSANAQLKALKGNPVSAPGNPAPPPFEDSPEQTQGPVTPEISSVARAASAYSAAVEDGLNSDELSAIQDLAGRVRPAVSDFLSQPGLEQAENAATVVASNPEAVQDLTASVGQAVVATLNLPDTVDEVIVNVASSNEDLLEEIPAPENLISVERVTNGAESNNSAPVIVASPALQNVPAQNAEVGNPVNIPVPSVDQGQGLEGTQAQTVNPEEVIAPPEGESHQTASGQSNPQPASGPQPGPTQSSHLFAQENAVVNPENIRNVNELVNSVVDNEFTSEAKKIFSEPKVIRTVADLVDFILERLREIIATKQQQSQSSGEIGLS